MSTPRREQAKDKGDAMFAPAGDDSDNSLSDQDSDDKLGTEPRRAKRRIIDETLLDEDEARRLEARRAYNRQCAAKARKRSKDLISHLQQQVEQLTKDKTTLERTNEVMQAQLQLLEQQNRTLMMNQRPHQNSMMTGGGTGSFLGAVQGGAGSMGQNAGNFPSVSLLESLSAQGRLASFQNDAHGQQNGLMNSVLPRAPASAGNAGIDPSKYYFG